MSATNRPTRYTAAGTGRLPTPNTSIARCTTAKNRAIRKKGW